MKEAQSPVWINEDVAAELRRIRAGRPGPSAAPQFLGIGPPRPRSPDVPDAASKHSAGAIEATCLVDENRPTDAGLVDVRPRHVTLLEGDDDDLRVEIDQRPFVLLQLQQVPSAWQSTEVAVKHEQQPVSPVLLEAVDPAPGVGQGKRHRRSPDEIHSADSPTTRTRTANARRV